MTVTATGPHARAEGWSTAVRFFWCWLVVATSMSLCGNVAHALLIAPADTRWMAAVAALVPPVVLLAAMHSMGLLARTRTGGGVYWVALAATVLLALGAFVLSFDALRSLAVTVGIRPAISWIWPAVIDVAIAQATLCLLSLGRRPRAAPTATAAPPRPGSGQAEQLASARSRGSAEPVTGVRGPDRHAGPASAPVAKAPRPTPAKTPPAPARERALAAVPDSPAPINGARRGLPGDVLDSAAIRRWQPLAESLVRDGVTSKRPDLVATILAERAAGTPPSTIGRQYNVHHTTVGRILDAAKELSG